MKTTFGRQFALMAGLILLSLVLLSVGFRSALFGYVIDEKEKSLQANATAVAQLAAAYDTTGELENNWDFRMSLTFSTQVAETDAVICDTEGIVILCSCDELHCSHVGKQIDASFVSRVIEQGQVHERGALEGLYNERRYVTSVPIVSQGADETIGIVIVSSPATQINEFMMQTFNMFLTIAVIVLMVAMLAISILAQSQSRPLKELANAARRFGHGDLHIRVATGGSHTEEIDELAVAFNNMADSLEQSEQRRREFVANVSHELRTPMTTIGGFMDGMLDGTIPPERYRQYMQAVSDEVHRLARLVRSMLEVSRLQAQGISPAQKRKFDICESVGQVLLTFEQRINEKSLTVDVQMPEKAVMVLAEPDSITQVLYNLIDNAVKFVEPEGILRIGVRTSGGKALVSVANTGPTVPEKELALIFERFHKTDKSRSSNREGVGLGLYIVKTIIGSHGEDISVTSRDGVTEFVFTLPLTK